GDRRFSFREPLAQFGVRKLRRRMFFQRKCHGKHDIAAAFDEVENASAIGEPARRIIEFDDLVGDAVKTPDGKDRLRNVLSVSADVLHRSSADRTGNSAQAFDAGEVTPDTFGDESVPIFTRRRGHVAVIAEIIEAYAFHSYMDDVSVEAIVRDEQIAAAAEN